MQHDKAALSHLPAIAAGFSTLLARRIVFYRLLQRLWACPSADLDDGLIKADNVAIVKYF